MKPHWIIFALAFALSTAAQDKKPDAKPVPLASAELGLKIRNVQLEQAQLKETYQQYQAALEKIKAQFVADQTKLADLEKQAFAAQKLSDKEYDFDANALTFTEKPKPETSKSAQKKAN